MATLQICYLKQGQVVCTSAAAALKAAPEENMITTMTSTKPDKAKVKKDVDALLEALLDSSPDFFVLSYNP
jgi:hypothetical protein